MNIYISMLGDIGQKSLIMQVNYYGNKAII